MAGGLLVSRIHDANAFIEATIIDGLNVAAAQGKNVGDAVPLESLRDQAAAMHLSHVEDYRRRLSDKPGD